MSILADRPDLAALRDVYLQHLDWSLRRLASRAGVSHETVRQGLIALRLPRQTHRKHSDMPVRHCVICEKVLTYSQHHCCSMDCHSKRLGPRRVFMFCALCGRGFSIEASQVRWRRKRGQVDFCCALSCAARLRWKRRYEDAGGAVLHAPPLVKRASKEVLGA